MPDSATFGVSSQTAISADIDLELANLTFDTGASAYTISTVKDLAISIQGGIFNNSGIHQNFVIQLGNRGVNGSIEFDGSATVDPNCIITCAAGATLYTGELGFNENSNAGEGTYINEGCAVPGAYGAHTDFGEQASAGNATFINNGGLSVQAAGGQVNFFYGSTAGNATFINNAGRAAQAYGGSTQLLGTDAGNATMIANGADVADALGGRIIFFETTHAANATLVANGGTNGGLGGTISFGDVSYGDNAIIQVFGNGSLEDVTYHVAPLSIGSLEGDGIVKLSADHALNIGANGLSTTFSGSIQGSNSIVKIGSGTLTLGGANIYTGGTAVIAGALKIGNESGSATGTGTVNVRRNSRRQRNHRWRNDDWNRERHGSFSTA